MISVVGAVFVAATLFVQAVSTGLHAAELKTSIHHAADVRLDPGSRSLTVFDVITVSGRTEIHFRLASWLSVKSLLLDRRPIPISATAGAWRTKLPDLGRHQVELKLQGTVPAQRGRGMDQSAVLGPDGGYLFEGAGWIPDTGDDWVS